MNILEKVLRFNNHRRDDDVDFSASEIASKSNYQLYLGSIGTPQTHENPLELQVSAQVGNGIHLVAEQALKDDVSVLSEYYMKEYIGKYKVSGTADVIRIQDDMYIVGDFKTKGTFQMKKALTDPMDDVKVQMSIYAYLFSKERNVPMPIYGEVYLIHVGDKGYFTKKGL